MAHGKPDYKASDKVVDADEADMMIDLSAEWQQLGYNEAFLQQAYEDINEIWKGLLLASKIPVFETLSGGSHTIKIVEKDAGAS